MPKPSEYLRHAVSRGGDAKGRYSPFWLVGLVVFSVVLIGIFPLVFPLEPPDSDQYLRIAEGRVAEVPRPFSNRILQPTIARLLSSQLGVTLPLGFASTQAVYLMGFIACLALLLNRLKIDGRLAAGALSLPVFVTTIAAIYLPDLGSMAWVAAILLALAYERYPLAALMLIPAIASRETTILLSAVMVLIFLTRQRYTSAILVAVCTIVGAVVNSRISAGGAPNIHELNPLLYMVLKVPVNFAGNLLGLQLWTDSFRWCDDPFFTMALPSQLTFGKASRIGMCARSLSHVLVEWTTYLAVFGIAPSIVLACRNVIGATLGSVQIAVLASLAYGIAMYGLGPVSGKSVYRLAFYGWPAFVVALPYFITRSIDLGIRDTVSLALLHLCTAWGLYLSLALIEPMPASVSSMLFASGLVAQVAAYRIARRAVDGGRRADIESVKPASARP